VILPVLTVWDNSELLCVISGLSGGGRYLITVTEKARNQTVLEQVAASVDESLALAAAWTPKYCFAALGYETPPPTVRSET